MGNHTETLATYIGDMHALETHLLEAFERQLDLTKDVPEAHRVVQGLVTSTRQHVNALEQRLKAVSPSGGKGVSDTVKTAVSGLLGVAAGAIDAVRPQSVSKALRDSYTATNHAIIAYVMLNTTGEALNDKETANLATRHMQAHVSNIQSIASIMPKLVIHDLKDDVGTISDGAADTVTGNQDLATIFGGKQRTA